MRYGLKTDQQAIEDSVGDLVREGSHRYMVAAPGVRCEWPMSIQPTRDFWQGFDVGWR